MAQLDVHLPQGDKFPGFSSSQRVYELWPYVPIRVGMKVMMCLNFWPFRLCSASFSAFPLAIPLFLIH